ncbi:hypothetical protein LTS08_002150 [Lithohypha guttulata]|nr:hypothetical protein LTS08_002150 [Lithohypha guttulata]
MDDTSLTYSPHLSWPEEDKTPTTEREIRGFYSYGIAAEVFAVVGVGAFLPVTLEQLARENGVLFSDKSTPCVLPKVSQAFSARASDSTRDPDQCLIHLLGTDTTTASFAMYTFSLAVLCQALVLISFSSFADHGDNRKRLLLTFGTVGSLASMSFVFVMPSIYLAGAVLAIIGIVCLGSSFVVLNSFLPLLAANHPSVLNTQKERQSNTLHDSDNNLELQISTKISAEAIGLGYAAALLVQVLAIGVLLSMKKIFDDSISATVPLRLILFLAGIWWLAFMGPTALWLRKRPGPPLKDLKIDASRTKMARILAHVAFAWSSLWRTITVALRLKQMVIFLAAWFLLSDAQASVSGTAVLFARTELKIGTVGIALLSITVMIFGIVGASLLPVLSKRMRWTNSQTIVFCLVLMEFVPLYGLLGYLPFIQQWGFGGLQVWWEIYGLGVIFGTVIGGLSSYCRSLFGSFVPPGSEAAFFALFAITDKGSSAIGPAVVGRIVDATGHIRPAFWFLAVVVALPIPLIWYTDVNEGQLDARRMAVSLREDQRFGVQLRAVERREQAEGLLENEG